MLNFFVLHPLVLIFPLALMAMPLIAKWVLRSSRVSADSGASARASHWPAGRRKPYQDFHDGVWLPACESIALAVVEKTGKELTAQQRRIIWRARAPLMLDAVLGSIRSTEDAGQISALIAAVPTGLNRPDPTGWCGRSDYSPVEAPAE